MTNWPTIPSTFPELSTVLAAGLILGLGATAVAVALGRGGLRSSITVVAICNSSEQVLRAAIARLLRQAGFLDMMVFPQVSYGEFLKTSDRKLFWSFNAKRADMVIIAADYRPVAVVEYQGSGHWGRTRRDGRDAERRDTLKRRVLARAGLPLIEVPARWNESDLRKQLEVAFSAREKL
ncbi:DUF2726 domain-containing protein [Loktanella sp. IMCC34160]|uniref:DUF2726 domain-containing protein n=1 Tax=Loktanella sp. IMCC34160 TaxID=2510646 RepID=UPI0013EB9F9E|nr:DUF2726 domain-containing protein [Loktanella sp. IMCC34160]